MSSASRLSLINPRAAPVEPHAALIFGCGGCLVNGVRQLERGQAVAVATVSMRVVSRTSAAASRSSSRRSRTTGQMP